jgi:hypothetical protein
MDGDSNYSKDITASTQEEGQTFSPPSVKKSREELVEELTQFFEKLFEASNIVNNSYLVQRAQNEYFEIPIKFIYSERNVKNITQDREIVHEALEKNSNVVLKKKNDEVISITLKNFKLQRKIVIKNIPGNKIDAFKQFVNTLDENTNEKITNWNFNSQMNLVSVVCTDEASASQIYQRLSTSQFEGVNIDCSLASESLYISGMENLKKKAKSFKNPNPMFPMGMNTMFTYPYANYIDPYVMNAFYGNFANNYYASDYQNVNQFPVATQNDLKAAYPPRQKAYNNKQFYNNKNYKNDQKPYSQRIKQPRDNNFKHQNKQNHKSNFVVRENEFPPL